MNDYTKSILFSTEDYFAPIEDEDNFDNDIFDLDWSNFKDQLIDFNNKCILQGTEGLWNGKHKAGFCGDIEDAIDTALDKKDDFTFEMHVSIDTDEKELWLITYHHDGRNEYHIKQLTDKGEDLYDQWSSNYIEDKVLENIFTEEQLHDLLMQSPYSEDISF